MASKEPPPAAPGRATASEPAQPIALAVEQRGDAVVVRVRGELDILTAPAMADALAEAVAAGPRVVVVDLAEVAFCASSGLQAMLRARDAAGRHGVRLCLARLSPAAQRTMTVSGMLRLFEICPDVAAALR
jgi:anti-sigma B factor antagonist